MLNQSQILQENYGEPIYETEEIPTLDFETFIWLKRDTVYTQVIEPYKQLQWVFEDINEQDIELLISDDELNNGGLAQTAYAKCQFTDMSSDERKELEKDY